MLRPLYSSESHMVRGLGSALIEHELITALWSLLVVFLVSYAKSWKVYGGPASHGSAKTQRDG